MWNDTGTGQIAGYNGGDIQWYAGTDGKLYAGDGAVQFDSNGLRIFSGAATSSNAYNKVEFFVDIDESGSTSYEETGDIGQSWRNLALVDTYPDVYEFRARGLEIEAYETSADSMAPLHLTVPPGNNIFFHGDNYFFDGATQDFYLVDSGRTGATEQDWMEVNIGGHTGYIRVYSAK